MFTFALKYPRNLGYNCLRYEARYENKLLKYSFEIIILFKWAICLPVIFLINKSNGSHWRIKKSNEQVSEISNRQIARVKNRWQKAKSEK